MTIRDDEDDIVTLDDEDDGPSSKKSKNEENESRRSSRRGKDTYRADDDWTPTNKGTKKSSALSLTNEKEDGASQRKRARSPSPQGLSDYQKASRRSHPQRENGTNYRVSNDTLAQMLGVALARLEKLETDWKKKLDFEQKLDDLEATMTTMKEEVNSLKGKVDNGLGSGAILPIMDKIDKVKEDLADSKKSIDKMNVQVGCIDDLTKTYDKRFEGLKIKLKSNMDQLRVLEQNRNNDAETIESHAQKMDRLESSIHVMERGRDMTINNSASPSAKISQPHIATPEQMRKLPQFPIDFPSIIPSNSANEEEFISQGQVTDILNSLDEETTGQGALTFSATSSLNSDLPLFSQDEDMTSFEKPAENTSSSSTNEITNKQTDGASTNVTKSAPVKISLLSFKKKPAQTIAPDDKKNNDEIQGASTNLSSGVAESSLKESSQSDADNIKDSNDSDPSAPKKINKFFKSKTT